MKLYIVTGHTKGSAKRSSSSSQAAEIELIALGRARRADSRGAQLHVDLADPRALERSSTASRSGFAASASPRRLVNNAA